MKKELKKEQEELGKIVMSKKQRKLLEQSEKSKQSKKQEISRLKEKKKALVKQK